MRSTSRVRRARARRHALSLAVVAALASVAAGSFAAPTALGRMGGEPYRPMLKPDMPEAPDVAGATPAQHRAARALLRRSRRAAGGLDTPPGARRAGYRSSGRWSRDGMIHFHARALERDGRVLDPRRPESLVFMRMPGGGRMLAAFMFRARSDRRPPSPAGAIVRWHAHFRCVRRDRRDRHQVPSRHCRRAHQVAHYGKTQMTHVWFAAHLRDAFAMHPPMDAITGP